MHIVVVNIKCSVKELLDCSENNRLIETITDRSVHLMSQAKIILTEHHFIIITRNDIAWKSARPPRSIFAVESPDSFLWEDLLDQSNYLDGLTVV